MHKLKKCEECRNIIPKTKKVGWPKYQTKKFCSVPCKQDFMKAEIIKRICKNCKNEFPVALRNSTKNNKYCKRSCVNQAWSKDSVKYGYDHLDKIKYNNTTSRKRAIIDYRFGIGDGKAHTLSLTGEKFGVTKQRIEKIISDFIK